ncbi:MAG TPA: riboflavin synthase [Actinomycetota bacterium]|nr:riboflavin synthase [Actinomycetota bacterium]
MFTGIVEYQGSVVRLMRRGGGARLEVNAPEIVGELQIGDSVAVNGACVTVTERNTEAFACDLVPETVARTNLGILEVGEEVNLERPVRATDRLGGHIVQGHVDAVGLVRSRRRVGAQEVLEVTVPFELTRYLAPQGSVSLDGVSLTVVAVDRDRFRVALIPHTVSVTTLGRKGQGASVNVEVDVISKYVERHMAARAPRPAFTIFEEQPKERTEAPRPALPKPLPARPVAHTPPVAASRPRPPAKSAPKKAAKRPAASAKRSAKRAPAKPAKRRR